MAPEARLASRGADAPRGPSRWLALLGWVALALVAGGVGAFASRDAKVFYGALVKPAWAPPGWLFAPVWTALYVLMGIAAWLVWRAARTTAAEAASRRRGLTLFLLQLALNALWTWLFFAWRQGALAFGEIALLWLAIVATAWQFARVKPLAAWFLAPYLAWVTYAAALTWALWRANPGQL